MNLEGESDDGEGCGAKRLRRVFVRGSCGGRGIGDPSRSVESQHNLKLRDTRRGRFWGRGGTGRSLLRIKAR